MAVYPWQNMIRLRITGNDSTRYISMLCHHGIRMWDISDKIRENSCCVLIMQKDLKMAFELRKKADVCIRVIKSGGPFRLWKCIKRRRAAVFSAFAAFAALYVMSLFIWDISFCGNDKYTDSVMLSFVMKEGLHPGMLIADVSCEDIEKKIRNRFSDVTWVSARTEGTRLVIEINENRNVKDDILTEDICSLRAQKSGIVTEIITRKGLPVVKAGDFVKAGDLLVSGCIPVTDDFGTIQSYVCTTASADVWITYENHLTVKVPRKQTVRKYTGFSEGTGVVLFGYRFTLNGMSDSDSAEMYVSSCQARIFDNFYLPIYMEHYEKRKYIEESVMLDDNALESTAEKKYLNFLLNLDDLGVEIIQNNVTIKSDTAEYVLKSDMVLIKNAAEKAPIMEEELPQTGTYRGD